MYHVIDLTYLYACNCSISLDDCDALDGDCCSESFLKQCPNNPAQCPPKIACTTVAEYTAAMTKLSKSCCPAPGACSSGTPDMCSAACSVEVRTR